VLHLQLRNAHLVSVQASASYRFCATRSRVAFRAVVGDTRRIHRYWGLSAGVCWTSVGTWSNFFVAAETALNLPLVSQV
jgi:hypothetical protein